MPLTVSTFSPNRGEKRYSISLFLASPVVDMLSPSSLTRPLTPEELYGAPPLFNINTQPDPDLFEFTGSGSKLGPQPGVAKRKLNLTR